MLVTLWSEEAGLGQAPRGPGRTWPFAPPPRSSGRGCRQSVGGFVSVAQEVPTVEVLAQEASWTHGPPLSTLG